MRLPRSLSSKARITITLTNVKLGTALNALCDNALCSWSRLSGSPLKVTPLPSEKARGLRVTAETVKEVTSRG